MSTEEDKKNGVLTTQDNTQQSEPQQEKGLVKTLDISQETAPFIINPNFNTKNKQIEKLVDEKVIASLTDNYVSGKQSIKSICDDIGVPVYFFYKLKKISPEFASLIEGITDIRANVLIEEMHSLVNSLREELERVENPDPKVLHAKTNCVNVLCHNIKSLAGIFSPKYREKKAGSINIKTDNVNFVDMLKEPEKREVIEAPVVDTHQSD